MDVFELHVQPRQEVGKSASRRLRREGMVPAVIYGRNETPEQVAIDHNALMRRIEHEAFFSHILTVHVDGKKQGTRVILKELHRHPYKRKVLHLDLQRVSETEALHTSVPLHFLGEEDAPGAKQGGVFQRQLVQVEVSCLPKNLPEYIEADVSHFEIGDTLHLSDLKLPEGVELHNFDPEDEDQNWAIITLTMPRVAEEEVAEEEAAAEEAAEAAAGEGAAEESGAEETGGEAKGGDEDETSQ